MKTFQNILWLVLVIFSGIAGLYSCQKSNTDNSGSSTPAEDTTGGASFFERLDFFDMKQISGVPPKTSLSSSLKKSFQDTLILFENLQSPFKFLHEDSNQNVSGVFISYDNSPFYYDIPELPDSKINKTISVLTMGFKKRASNTPETFQITITPYNQSKQPLATFKTHVKVKKPGDIDVNGFCGLSLELDEFWDWELSYVPGLTDSGSIQFINYPLKVWGSGGQNIGGSCCTGVSIYGFCPNADTVNRSLHFNTFFGFPYEHFAFKSGGSFERNTAQIAGKPNLNASDWCAGLSFIDTSVQLVKYLGNWSVSQRAVPSGMNVDYTSREYLSLQTTSFEGGLGYGNPGGFLHLLECGAYLWLIQPEGEGSDRFLYKFYIRKKEIEEYWHIINS